MSKRVFTKLFAGSVSAPTGVVISNALDSLLLQEDIEVVGAEAVVQCFYPNENDGFASGQVELSQVGEWGKDGVILKAMADEWWNTVPAGIAQTNGHVAITFPLGLAIPVREEGYLYLNTYTVGKSAGVSTFSYSVIVYYTKKGAR